MDLQISYNFNQTASYTLNNGIAKAGGTNFEIRILHYPILTRFTSNIAGVTGAIELKGDSNPNAVYYIISIPQNNTGAPQLVQVYGFTPQASPSQGLLVLQIYQNG